MGFKVVRLLNKFDFKLYSALLSIAVFTVLINIVGVKFFLFDIELSEKMIDIKVVGVLLFMINLFVFAIKKVSFVFVTLLFKRNRVIEFLWISYSVTIMQIVFVNILNSGGELKQIIFLVIIYMPRYFVNILGIIIFDKLNPFIKDYIKETKVVREIVILSKITMILLLYSLIFTILWGNVIFFLQIF
ncbi:MAG: hypothetical protein K6G88_10365 [Lachnospiraceae bacterium]|nr:hypothetical protein [Lachnospiraceae bacterium]